jgi:hypothetical protein
MLDAHNRQQIDDLGGHSGRELVAMLAAIGPRRSAPVGGAQAVAPPAHG